MTLDELIEPINHLDDERKENDARRLMMAVLRELHDWDQRKFYAVMAYIIKGKLNDYSGKSSDVSSNTQQVSNTEVGTVRGHASDETPRVRRRST